MRRSRTLSAPHTGDNNRPTQADTAVTNNSPVVDDSFNHLRLRHEVESSLNSASSYAYLSESSALVNSIAASFVTLSSDAAPFLGSTTTIASPTMASTMQIETSSADSWAVGLELNEEEKNSSWLYFSQIETPLTPALVALSPGATPRFDVYGDEHRNRIKEGHNMNPSRKNHTAAYDDDDDENEYEDDDDDDDRMEKILRERRRRWAQEKIIHAVFQHPRSLRSFCWEAYQAAVDIRRQKEPAILHVDDNGIEGAPETQVEPTLISKKNKRNKKRALRIKIMHNLIDWTLHNVPISVILNILEAFGITAFYTVDASIHITIYSMEHVVWTLGGVFCAVWDGLKRCVSNPFTVLEAIISIQFNAMGKTSEVLVSGIQSVATGVGSASSLALYRLSSTTANISSQPSFVISGGNKHHFHSVTDTSKSGVLSKRLLRKLSNINDTALVVSYQESEESNGGLTRHAVSRTRRMMHYSVSLRPFLATIALPASSLSVKNDDSSFLSESMAVTAADRFQEMSSIHRGDSSSVRSSSEEDESPFMCTPQSFPPTPHSRQHVIAQRSQLSDDVVFLARDRLRVHGGLESHDARTRERSQALIDGKRLAIFSHDKDSGIELTCGQHIASKVNDSYYYASTRSLVSILRNCFVYFELSILPRPDTPFQSAATSLSVGVSTAEMTPNTLVGAWQGSVGLCTTGQILMAGQWCSPQDPALYAFGVGATIGCLVCLDDGSAFETWDGAMVKAKIRFNVNGVMVSSPVSTLPVSGAPTGISMNPSSPMINVEQSTTVQGGVTLPIPLSPPPPPSQRTEPAFATLTLLVPVAEDLFPTITLQSPATSVACRFSSEDILATAREAIGAPPGVAVYGVDGSIILTQDQEKTNAASTRS